MANNKLTWLELRKAVVERANCTEKEAESFLNALLESINEGLVSDKQVKIKGLGSFALKAVAPRKSVNIATGEDIVLEGYNKLTFNAESALKESVEKRIEKPATEEVVSSLQNDPMRKLGEQADEIVDLLAELGQVPAGEEKKAEGEEVKSEKAKKPKKATKAKAEKPKAKKTKKETTKIEAPTTEEPKTEPTTEPATPTTAKKACKCACNCKWIWWVLGAVILAGAVGTGVYYKEKIVGWWQCTSIMNRKIKPTEYHDILTNSKHIATQEVAVEKKSINKYWDQVCASVKAWDIKGKIESWNIDETIVGWWECIKFWEKEKEVTTVPTIPATPTLSGQEVKPLEPKAPVPPANGFNYDRMPGIETAYAEGTEYYALIEAVETLEETVEQVVEETIEQVVEEATVIIESEVETAVETVETIIEEVEEEVIATVALADLPRVYTQFVGTETVSKDSRLTWIAYKYYGSKDLWVFIYEANRDIISNPAKIKTGQKLRIPKLDEKYTDLNNPELRELVDELTEEYLQ